MEADTVSIFGNGGGAEQTGLLLHHADSQVEETVLPACQFSAVTCKFLPNFCIPSSVALANTWNFSFLCL